MVFGLFRNDGEAVGRETDFVVGDPKIASRVAREEIQCHL
jgi:hypothetical protein